MVSNLTLGNRNFVPEVTFVQKLYDWDGLSKPIKNLCRTTKSVHLIGCEGGNNFLGILKKSSWQPIKWTNFVAWHKFLLGFERSSQSYNWHRKTSPDLAIAGKGVRRLLRSPDFFLRSPFVIFAVYCVRRIFILNAFTLLWEFWIRFSGPLELIGVLKIKK